ncbi:helix-turn-helix domain-containing protein [Spirosoma sordidisoli]|uniref:XRE family transcriptional regulator n=1 Tax=Spirosoma sordidisoli TaxID=2502893 RepID=A0A4Q2UNF1_9BACT|nr:helix-turn-helix transcriptional regulator [Spirosoma sordidisoli]RYC70856.1 XRE family transcriptional regulator [Spirosoma sordidisoli]
MPTITETTGKLIREARKAAGLTQKELGEKMGVSESTVNKYEAGKQNLSIETVERIAKALGAELEIYFKK